MNYLKCDADGCDHREKVQEITEDDIGKKCSVCGANLLTREDFEAFQPVAGIIEVLKGLGLARDGEIGEKLEDEIFASVNCHKGKTTIKIE